MVRTMNARKAQEIAEELGLDIEPVAIPRRRTTKKRTPNRNGPVERTVLWETVNPETRREALLRAGGDITRCKPISHDTVVVVNNPGKRPR